jgi:hypothetical protein
MREYHFKKTIGLTEEDIADILCAAIEGGSSYWAQIQNLGEEWDEVEKELPKGHTIEDHIIALWHKGYALCILDCEEDEEHLIYLDNFLQGIQSVIGNGIWDGEDVYDVDGEVGDCIMQYAAFGEVIYG